MEASRAERAAAAEAAATTKTLLTARIKEVERAFACVNQEFFENLRLFVERVMLYRVTRAEQKNMELDFFIAILKESIGLKKKGGKNRGDVSADQPAQEEDPRSELVERLSGYREASSRLQLSALFSAMIEATEHLDPSELLHLLERLRTAPIFRASAVNSS